MMELPEKINGQIAVCETTSLHAVNKFAQRLGKKVVDFRVRFRAVDSFVPSCRVG